MSDFDPNLSFPKCMANFARATADAICALRQAPPCCEAPEDNENELCVFIAQRIAEARAWINAMAPMIFYDAEHVALYTTRTIGQLLVLLVEARRPSRLGLIEEAHRQSFSPQHRNSEMYQEERGVVFRALCMDALVGKFSSDLAVFEADAQLLDDIERFDAGERPEAGDA